MSTYGSNPAGYSWLKAAQHIYSTTTSPPGSTKISYFKVISPYHTILMSVFYRFLPIEIGEAGCYYIVTKKKYRDTSKETASINGIQL